MLLSCAALWCARSERRGTTTVERLPIKFTLAWGAEKLRRRLSRRVVVDETRLGYDSYIS
jgi:hypothetical protein